jgi:hypothetical protein
VQQGNEEILRITNLVRVIVAKTTETTVRNVPENLVPEITRTAVLIVVVQTGTSSDGNLERRDGLEWDNLAIRLQKFKEVILRPAKRTSETKRSIAGFNHLLDNPAKLALKIVPNVLGVQRREFFGFVVDGLDQCIRDDYLTLLKGFRSLLLAAILTSSAGAERAR